MFKITKIKTVIFFWALFVFAVSATVYVKEQHHDFMHHTTN